MKKFIYAILLFTLSIAQSCDGQGLLLNNYSLLSSANFDVFGVLGDSKSDLRITSGGSGTAVIPTLASGIGYQYQRAPHKVIPITTPASVLYGIGTVGGWANQFCKDYNSYSQGRKPVLVISGKGNSKFVSAGDSLSWYTNGLLYDSMKKRVNDCLAYLGRSKPAGFIVILGVNGVDGATSESTAVTSLITRLNSDYNNPPIYINMPHKTSSMSYATKSLIKALETTYSNVHCTVNEATLFANNYTGDGIHFNEKGSNVLGHMLARYITSSIADLDLRRLITCNFVNDLTSYEEAAWTTFVNDAKTNGWFTDISSYQEYTASSPENKLTDFNGMIAPYPKSCDLSNHNYIGTGGTSTTFIDTQYNVSLPGNSSQNDYIEGTYVLTNSTAAGTQATLFGDNTGSVFTFLRQTSGSAIQWGVNQAAVTYSTDTKIKDNTEHAVLRTASNASAYYQNNASVATSSATSSTPPTFSHAVGARGVSGGFFAGEYLQVQVKCFYVLKTGHYSQFLTAKSTLESNL